MVGEAAAGSFVLGYDLEPGDVAHIIAAGRGRRIRRTRLLVGAAGWLLFAGLLTAFTVAVDRSPEPGSEGAPSWMYVADVVCWYVAMACAWMAWRLGPGRLARRAWRRSPRHRIRPRQAPGRRQHGRP
jgi:hypothetical protein